MGRGGRCRGGILLFWLLFGLPFDQEFGIDGDLECSGEGVGLGGHADDGEEFRVLLVGHSFGTCGGSVGVDAVATVIGDGDGDVDEFFGERVERAGSDHDLLDAGPGMLEEIGLIGEGSPEVVNEVGFSGGADVVEDGLDAWIGGDFGVGEELLRGHGVFTIIVGWRLDECR
jgi:hypothetical protein